MEYRHAQHSYLWVYLLAWFALIAVGIAVLADDEAESVWIMAIAATALLTIAVVTFWFSRLTVIVSVEGVTCYFGAGRPRRMAARHTIIGFRRVRNKWYYGWGIRKISEGWMYNVWGLDAVELELADGTKFRIGTDEPDDLMAAISGVTGLRPG